MPTGIGYENAEAFPASHREGDEIKAVAPYVMGAQRLPTNPEPRKRGHGFGQESLLNLPGDAAIFRLPLQLPLSLPALDELRDLATDAGHHLDQVVVRLPYFSTAKLQDALNLPIPNGKTNRPMQATLSRNLTAREVGSRTYVGEPNRVPRRPKHIPASRRPVRTCAAV